MVEKVTKMRVKLTIPSNDVFQIFWYATCLGRVLLMNDVGGKQSREERQRDTNIVKALHAVSDPAPEGTEPIQSGDKPRVFHDGGEIELWYDEVQRLVALIDRIGWTTPKLEVVEVAMTLLTQKQ